MEFWKRFGGRLHVDFLASLLSVAYGCEPRFRFFVVGMFRNWFGRESLDARRTPFSAHVRRMVWTGGRCLQVVRSLRGSVHRALFVSAWNFTSHSWSHS